MKENNPENENRMLVLASEIRRLTNGMCRVGIGPYGFGVENANPAQIGVAIRLQPDPFGDHPQPLEAGKTYQATVEGFRKDGGSPLLPEDVTAFMDSSDPATRTIASAIRKLSEETFQMNGEECAEAFGIMAEREMKGPGTGLTKDAFWDVIDKNRAAAGKDDQKFLQQIHTELMELDVQEIGRFKGILEEYKDLAYMPRLWDAAKLMNECGCSDDGFIDFRAWLVSQGKETYLEALADSDSLAAVDSPADCAFESFSYVADMAYEQKTGHRFLPDAALRLDAGTLDSIHAEIRYAKGIDRLRTGKEIPDALPRLCEKFYPGQDVAADWPEWLPVAKGTSWGSMKM